MRDDDGTARWRAQRTPEDRLDSLIVAAAAVADRVGLDHLTTTLVAKEAGASIGTIYRYFPDRMGVIEGLRERNAAILHDRLHAALAARLDGWASAVDAILGAVVGAYREVPGFRAVTTRDWLGDEGSMTMACIERLARASLAHVPASTRGSVASERLEGAVRILDALTRSAFEASADGDPAVLELARTHALDEVGAAPSVVRVDRVRLLGGVLRRGTR